jgi:hypothetical protein
MGLIYISVFVSRAHSRVVEEQDTFDMEELAKVYNCTSTECHAFFKK